MNNTRNCIVLITLKLSRNENVEDCLGSAFENSDLVVWRNTHNYIPMSL